MIQRLFGALFLIAGGIASVAEAGVTGNNYTGLVTLSNDQTGLSTAAFGTETWTFSRQFLGDPQPVFESGRFSEQDLFVISIWEGTLVTPGTRTARPVNGISIFGIITTLNAPGPGDTPIATGIYISDSFQLPGMAQAGEPGGFVPSCDTTFSAACLASPRDAVLRARRER